MQNWTYSEVLQKAWDCIKGNLPFTAGLTVVYTIACAGLGFVPLVGGVLMAPLLAGYIRCLLKIRKGETMGYPDFFWGFMDLNRLAQIILLNILVTLGVVLGLVMLVIPGIWFMVSSMLASTHIVLFGGDAINSIKKSMALVKQDWFKFFGMLLVIVVFNVVGALCLLVGLFVTIPVTVLASVIILESLSDVARPPVNQ